MPLEFINSNFPSVATVKCDNGKAMGKNGTERALKDQQK